MSDSHTSTSAPQTEGITIRWAAAYDVLVQFITIGQARRLRRCIVDLVQIKPGESILDVGCGTGDVALALERRLNGNGRIVGIDASPEMIERAQHKARRLKSPVDFRVSAAESLPFASGSFDHVVSSLVLHHLPGDLKRRVFLSIADVLKPGGQLTIVDFINPTGQILRHTSTPTDDVSILDLLRDAGFEEIRNGPLNFRSLGAIVGLPPISYIQGWKKAQVIDERE
jgi:ubiquinone/menaquinone biosynthesis C-methylase UbiE